MVPHCGGCIFQHSHLAGGGPKLLISLLVTTREVSRRASIPRKGVGRFWRHCRVSGWWKLKLFWCNRQNRDHCLSQCGHLCVQLWATFSSTASLTSSSFATDFHDDDTNVHRNLSLTFYGSLLGLVWRLWEALCWASPRDWSPQSRCFPCVNGHCEHRRNQSVH